MSILCIDPSTSIEHAVGASSSTFGAAMSAGQVWVFTSNVDCWISQGATPVATAGSGSTFVPARTPWPVSGRAGADLAVIQDSTGGKASLARAIKE